MISTQNIIDSFISSLLKELPKDTRVKHQGQQLELLYDGHACHIEFFKTRPNCQNHGLLLPIDLLLTRQQKLIAIIQSKLHYTRTVYARNCPVKKIQSETAAAFLNSYHLMNHAKAAYYYGLYDTGELVAVASFSKGRKMNRLNGSLRSFELVRFCCKEGISVSGGLSKLMSSFILDKQPGDIMTYVDKQFSNGKSYYACGFNKHSETEAHAFMVNADTMERSYFSESEFDETKHYKTFNCGNIKLIYHIEY